MRKLLLFFLIFSVIACSTPSDEPGTNPGDTTPTWQTELYRTIQNIKSTPLGLWKNVNEDNISMYFEFSSSGSDTNCSSSMDNTKTWKFYVGTEANTKATGCWAAHTVDGIRYIRMEYTYDALTASTYSSSNASDHRTVIVEYFADDNHFALNPYRGTSQDLMGGSWIHNNYQHYPGYSAYSYNRVGTLTFANNNSNTDFIFSGNVTYIQNGSPFFKSGVSTEMDNLIDGLDTSVSSADKTVTANYYAILQANEANYDTTTDITLSWSNATDTTIMPDAQFGIVVKTGSTTQYLLTYPFKRVTN